MRAFKKGFFTTIVLFLLITFAFFGTSTVGYAAGAASTGKWITSGSTVKYRYADGTYARNGFVKINGRWFYFKKNGKMLTGLRTIDGVVYYFRKSGSAGLKGKVLTGWRTIGGKRYYFRKSGGAGVKGAAYKSEWVTIDGQRYYFNCDGSLNTNVLTEEEFINLIAPLAQQDMKKSGILASVTIAQAILESGYGSSALGMEANNLFGMKASLSGNTWPSKWGGKTFVKYTQEYLNKKWYTISDTFRAYDSFAESIADHSAYLTYAMNGSKLRYEGVVGNTSYKKTVKLIKKGGYATDPKYVTKVCSLIKKYKLTKYDK